MNGDPIFQANVYPRSLPSGIPGRISRGNPTIESGDPDESKPFTAYGLPVKKVAGRVVPIEAGDAADVVFGFLAESFPTSDTRLVTRGVLSGSVPVAYNPHAVLRRGYMHVLANGGAAYETADGGQVYVRIANPMPGLPIGGIEALNGPDVVAIPRAFFKGRRDQAKNVEIEFNI